MIFPVRCFTCGKCIGHLQNKYDTIRKKKGNATALDELNMKRYCCRRMFLTHVTLVQ